MKPVIKICGMREASNLKDVSTLSADLIGFIFHERSPRFVGQDFRVDDRLAIGKRVGIFVDESFERIEELRKEHHLNWVQLHGQESVQLAQAGREAGWQIIKAFSVDANFDFAYTEAYAPFCRYFLFDTKGVYPGGNGRPFDWSHLVNYRGQVPFLLSGGLSVEMLPAIKTFRHPKLAGYDFNSGLEIAPGRKSVERVEIVINELKK